MIIVFLIYKEEFWKFSLIANNVKIQSEQINIYMSTWELQMFEKSCKKPPTFKLKLGNDKPNIKKRLR